MTENWREGNNGMNNRAEKGRWDMKAFFVRMISAAAIIGILLYYNSAVQDRREQEAALEAGHGSDGGMTGEADGVKESGEGGNGSGYVDGVYTGEGDGFGGVISVEVEIADGRIADIRILSAEDEDKAYFAMALDVVDAVLNTQTDEVDTVSGATYSSAGIREAITAALLKAQRP